MNNAVETGVAPKAISISISGWVGFGRDWKSLGRAMLRAPSVQITSSCPFNLSLKVQQIIFRSAHQFGEREEEMVPAPEVFSPTSTGSYSMTSLPLLADGGCARCEDQLSGGRCPRLSIHPQHCAVHCAPNPDQTGKNVRANLSPARLFSIAQN